MEANPVSPPVGTVPSIAADHYEVSLKMMETVTVEIPAELVRAAGWNTENPSVEAARALALELYRQDKVSLGRAAELCQMPVEQFMEFAARYNVPLHYGAADLDEDRRTLERLGL